MVYVIKLIDQNIITCKDCNGRGDFDRDWDDDPLVSTRCSKCGGSGKLRIGEKFLLWGLGDTFKVNQYKFNSCGLFVSDGIYGKVEEAGSIDLFTSKTLANKECAKRNKMIKKGLGLK